MGVQCRAGILRIQRTCTKPHLSFWPSGIAAQASRAGQQHPQGPPPPRAVCRRWALRSGTRGSPVVGRMPGAELSCRSRRRRNPAADCQSRTPFGPAPFDGARRAYPDRAAGRSIAATSRRPRPHGLRRNGLTVPSCRMSFASPAAARFDPRTCGFRPRILAVLGNNDFPVMGTARRCAAALLHGPAPGCPSNNHRTCRERSCDADQAARFAVAQGTPAVAKLSCRHGGERHATDHAGRRLRREGTDRAARKAGARDRPAGRAVAHHHHHDLRYRHPYPEGRIPGRAGPHHRP